jgi:leader peptidase (prepilin peptidase)/N-methyltransferase
LGFLSAALGYLPVSISDSVFGAALGFILPWSVNKIYFLFRKHNGFGGGDFKLLAAIGAWTGWPDIVPVLCVASIIGLVMIGAANLIRWRKIRMQQAFPFGPFLILSGMTFIIQSI